MALACSIQVVDRSNDQRMRYSNFTIYTILPCACIMAGCVAFSPESRIGEMASPTSWAASK
ncbi:MAG: hypothetical protein ACK5TA_05040, partial [bacterium]